jgi:hypothetical protein
MVAVEDVQIEVEEVGPGDGAGILVNAHSAEGWVL